MQIPSLDEYDNRITDLLKDQARLSYSEIAEKVGLSRTAVKKRMQALEKAGYIRGYHADVSIEQTGESITFFLDIETDPEQFEEVSLRLSEEKAITKLYALSGACHLLATGTAVNQETLRACFNSLRRNLSGVRKMTCHIVLDVLKDVSAGIVCTKKEGANDKH